METEYSSSVVRAAAVPWRDALNGWRELKMDRSIFMFLYVVEDIFGLLQTGVKVVGHSSARM